MPILPDMDKKTVSLILTSTLEGRKYYLYFTEEETEVQRGTLPRVMQPVSNKMGFELAFFPDPDSNFGSIIVSYYPYA